MKKKKILLLGLISLVGLELFSSCEDKFIYDKEKDFVPIGYLPKEPKVTETDIKDDLGEISTFQIRGLMGLVFDEVEKNDWKIITPSEFSVKGKEPLSIGDNVFELGMKFPTSSALEIVTNYGEIPVAYANTTLIYQYRGQDIELPPLGEVRLTVIIKENERKETPYFFQYGELEFILSIDYMPIKRHSINFFIIDPSIIDV